MIQLNDATWSTLRAAHTKPALLPGAFSPSSLELWEVFAGVCRAKKQGHTEARLRFYLEQKLQGAYVYAELFDPSPFLPQASHHSFEAYARALEERLQGQRFGIVVNNLHIFDFEFWQNTRAFFERIYQSRGLPTGGASFDLFLGNYHRTPFGIHKDDQDVYTWVLHGEKRFHLWPFGRLAGRPELSLVREGLEKKGAKLQLSTEEEYQQLLNDSIVLDAKPGDLMYWPASYWHCADNPEGALALTVGPGIVFDGNLIATQTQSYWEDVFLFDPNDAARKKNQGIKSIQFSAALRKLVDDAQLADFQRELGKSYLAAQTGSFFFNVPAPLAVAALKEDEMLQGDTRGPLRWMSLSKTEWVFSANGQAATLSAPVSILNKLEQMFLEINAGEARRVSELLARFRGRAAHARRAALGVIELLVSWRALRRVSLPPGRRSSCLSDTGRASSALV